MVLATLDGFGYLYVSRRDGNANAIGSRGANEMSSKAAGNTAQRFAELHTFDVVDSVPSQTAYQPKINDNRRKQSEPNTSLDLLGPATGSWFEPETRATNNSWPQFARGQADDEGARMDRGRGERKTITQRNHDLVFECHTLRPKFGIDGPFNASRVTGLVSSWRWNQVLGGAG